MKAVLHTTQENMVKKYNKRREIKYKPQVDDKVLYCERKRSKLTGSINWLPAVGSKYKHVIIQRLDSMGRATLVDLDGNTLDDKYPSDHIKKVNTAEDFLTNKHDTETEDEYISDTESEYVTDESEIEYFRTDDEDGEDNEDGDDAADVGSQVGMVSESTLIDILKKAETKYLKYLSDTKLKIQLDLRTHIFNEQPTWKFIKNGNVLCAFISGIAGLACTKSIMSFYQSFQPTTAHEIFCQQLLRMFNGAMTHAIDNKSSSSLLTAFRTYDIIVKLIEQWIPLRGKSTGSFYSIEEAVNILSFEEPEMITALKNANVTGGDYVILNICSNLDCQQITTGEGTKKNHVTYWNEWSYDTLKKMVHDSMEIVVVCPSFVFCEVNILAGAHPNGRCDKCNHTNFTINFRQPTDVITVQIPHNLNLFSNFNVQQLQSVSLIDLAG
eukprot:210372_1